VKISVIGCGYLGAVHAAAMAELGHDVIAIDTNKARIEALQRGVAPFHEPNFENLLKRNYSRLTFTTDISKIRESRVHFIAVGTPQAADSSADMTFIYGAFENLIPYLSGGDLVVGKSTVPVGTANQLSARIAELEAHLIWNPEFLREGFAVEDTLSPDRLVYGVPEGIDGEEASRILDEVYESILERGCPRLIMNSSTAELVKVAANSFLATKISFINAMAEIAEVTGADVTQLADAIGYDSRIGRKFLNAGIGFGGGCLPKDIRAFMVRADQLGVGEALTFLKSIESINLRRREQVTRLLKEELGQIKGKKIAIWGIAFKPNSDDIRDSPALSIAHSLAAHGAIVVSADPMAWKASTEQIPGDADIGFHSVIQDHITAVEGADALVVATEWDIFINEDPNRVGPLMKSKLVIDGRNCLDSLVWKSAGFRIRGFGRLY